MLQFVQHCLLEKSFEFNSNGAYRAVFEADVLIQMQKCWPIRPSFWQFKILCTAVTYKNNKLSLVPSILVCKDA